jgi:hypothetical protein
MTNEETARRALHQVWGNFTPAERERLEIRSRECWRQQANGNAGSQCNAADALSDEIGLIIEHMPAWRLDLIGRYIRGEAPK